MASDHRMVVKGILADNLLTQIPTFTKDPDDATKALINPAWYEISRRASMQVWLSTTEDRFGSDTEYIQMAQNIVVSPIGKKDTLAVYCGAPTEADRKTLREALETILQDTLLIQNPASDIDIILLKHGWPMDQDKKGAKACPAWLHVFELRVLR